MKRFALVLTVVAAWAVFGTTSANASDHHYGRGYAGHTSYARQYAGYGYTPRHGSAGYRYVAPAYGHGAVQRGYGGHAYAPPVYRGHGYYRSYGHGGGIRISTPQFGLRIGH